jgi:hypothetical protein
MLTEGYLLSVLENKTVKGIRGSKREEKKRRPKKFHCKRRYSLSDINDDDVSGRNSVHGRN